MDRTILFLCPHNAAKSIIAAGYFQQLADRRGLHLRAISAGTEPDAAVSPAVVTLLQAEGMDVSAYTPRLVTAEDLTCAAHIISLGCDPNDLPVPTLNLEQWDDIPPPSVNPTGARDAIRAHIERLVDALAQTDSAR